MILIMSVYWTCMMETLAATISSIVGSNLLETLLGVVVSLWMLSFLPVPTILGVFTQGVKLYFTYCSERFNEVIWRAVQGTDLTHHLLRTLLSGHTRVYRQYEGDAQWQHNNRPDYSHGKTTFAVLHGQESHSFSRRSNQQWKELICERAPWWIIHANIRSSLHFPHSAS